MLERFRLDWEPEGEEHGLIANRCSDTHMPVVLLIDLDTPGPGAGSGGGGGRAGVGNGPRGGVKDRGEAGGAQAAASGAGASKQPPKMTLMKRVPSKEGMERSKNKVRHSPCAFLNPNPNLRIPCPLTRIRTLCTYPRLDP